MNNFDEFYNDFINKFYNDVIIEKKIPFRKLNKYQKIAGLGLYYDSLFNNSGIIGFLDSNKSEKFSYIMLKKSIFSIGGKKHLSNFNKCYFLGKLLNLIYIEKLDEIVQNLEYDYYDFDPSFADLTEKYMKKYIDYLKW
jgi:hypothetical protein